jgi:hypothetical protein
MGQAAVNASGGNSCGRQCHYGTNAYRADRAARQSDFPHSGSATDIKLLGSYTIPRIDLQVSGTLQNLPGPEIGANFVAANALIAPSLGRNLSGNALNKTINLVEPGTMYRDRLTQLDLRFAKILRFGRTKSTLQIDLYNALNTDAVLTSNNNFGTWLRPQSIILARFAKFGLQFDF